MEERTTVRLPQELLARAKRRAAAEGRTLTSLIADGRKSAQAKRILPPVSKAAGGLLPGVDMADARSLQETDDIDYMRRLTRSNDPA